MVVVVRCYTKNREAENVRILNIVSYQSLLSTQLHDLAARLIPSPAHPIQKHVQLKTQLAT